MGALERSLLPSADAGGGQNAAVQKTARRGCGLENAAKTLQRGHQPDEILQYVLRGINQQETADGAQCFIRRSYFKRSRRNDPAENNRIAGSLLSAVSADGVPYPLQAGTDNGAGHGQVQPDIARRIAHKEGVSSF